MVLEETVTVVVAVWLGCAIAIYRTYREHLLAGLRHRFLEPESLVLDEHGSLDAVERLLASDDPLEPEQLVLDGIGAAAGQCSGRQGLDGEVLDRVDQVALGGPPLPDHAGHELNSGRSDLVGEQPPHELAFGAGLTSGVRQGPAQSSAGLEGTAHTEEVVGQGGRFDGPAGSTGQQRVQGSLAVSGRRARGSLHQTSPPTRSGLMSPDSSSARKRSTMPFWRTSSCSDSPTIRLARSVDKRPTSPRSEVTALWRSASI